MSDIPIPVAQDPEPTPVEAHEGDTPPAPINPIITTSVEVNWGSCASFFSSRKFIVKTLGYGVSSGGRR